MSDVSADNLDELIKKARVQKAVKQIQLIDRQLNGAIPLAEHESALAAQKDALLAKFGDILGQVTDELVARRIVKEKSREQCNEAIDSLVASLW